MKKQAKREYDNAIKELDSNKKELTDEVEEKRKEVDRLLKKNRELNEKIDMQKIQLKAAVNAKIEELYKE